MSKAGRIEIDVWRGGYPVWCYLKVDGQEKASFHHSELSDLRYAVEKAIQEAYAELNRMQPKEDNKSEMLLPR